MEGERAFVDVVVITNESSLGMTALAVVLSIAMK